MSLVKNVQSKEGGWKLARFYYATQFSGLFVLFIIDLAILITPRTFDFLGNIYFIFLLCFFMFFYHGVFFYLQEKYHKKIYYSLSRYGWLVFFLAVVYISGGVQSQVIFLLMFPLLTSVVDLDGRDTKVIGVIGTLVFATFLFVDSSISITSTLLTQHIFNTALLGTISYYAYQIVSTTLHHKYEKEEIRKQLANLTEIDKAKEDFLTVASHQLRTPLTGVRWGIEDILTIENLPQSATERLGVNLKKVERAIQIVDEMLHTTDIGVQGVLMKEEKVDLSTLLQSIVSELEYLSRSRGVAVNLHSKENSHFVSGDIKLLRPAFINVIDNAIRYSPGGIVKINITDDGARVVISVSDSGIGIPESDQHHIFERFYRSSNAIALDSNETGVGLYTTRRVVELHKGTISFVSVQNKGTTFTISLPIYQGK
jgi:signal transduction histidine kinase